MEWIESKLQKTNDSIQIVASAFLFFYVFLTINILSILFKLINFNADFLKFKVLLYGISIISLIINYYLILFDNKYLNMISYYRNKHKTQNRKRVVLFFLSIIISLIIFLVLITSVRNQIAIKHATAMLVM
jgi:small-conductance mechanosensitive channel